MALSPQLSKFPTFDSVTLSTVDRFQGDEADIVIISLVIFSLIYYYIVATMDFSPALCKQSGGWPSHGPLVVFNGSFLASNTGY